MLVICQLVYWVKGTAKRIYDKIVASSESIIKFDGMTRKGLNGLWFPFRTKSQKTANGTVTSRINVLKLRFVRILLIEFSFCLKII